MQVDKGKPVLLSKRSDCRSVVFQKVENARFVPAGHAADGGDEHRLCAFLKHLIAYSFKVILILLICLKVSAFLVVVAELDQAEVAGPHVLKHDAKMPVLHKAAGREARMGHVAHCILRQKSRQHLSPAAVAVKGVVCNGVLVRHGGIPGDKHGSHCAFLRAHIRKRRRETP